MVRIKRLGLMPRIKCLSADMLWLLSRRQKCFKNSIVYWVAPEKYVSNASS